jgi:hypothetical protein
MLIDPMINYITAVFFLMRRYVMNGRSQMQGGKNWILPKEIGKWKPVHLRLSLAGYLEKPLMFPYGLWTLAS